MDGSARGRGRRQRVDNGHAITNEFGLGEDIPLAQEGFPGITFDIPTDGIDTSGTGRVRIGVVPEPATVVRLASGATVAPQR